MSGSPCPKPKKKKPSAKSLLALADKLACEWCKRDGKCTACGVDGETCAGRLEWCHLKSRSHRHIRHDPLNFMPLCWKHHKFYTNHPDLWVDFVEGLFPGRWEQLNAILIKTKGQKVNYEKCIEFFKSQKRAA